MTNAKWLTPNLTNPIPIAETVNSVLEPTIGAITGLLNITAAILDILAFLNSLSVDPLQAALEALLNAVTEILDSLLNFAFTVFVYSTPGSDPQTAGGYSQFVADLEASLDDPGDLARPRITESSPFFAFALGTGALAPLDFMAFLKKFAEFTTEKFFKIQNAIFTFIPQAPGLGVITGLDVTLEEGKLKISAGKFLQKDDGIREVLAGDLTQFNASLQYYESSSAYAVVIFYAPLSNGIYIVPTKIGDVVVTNPGTEQEVVTINRDVALLAKLGFETTFIATFETDPTGAVINFNPNYRKVLVGYTEPELLDLVKAETVKSTDYDWRGFSIQSIKWFEPILKEINEARRKGSPQSNISNSLTQLKALVTTISQDLNDVAQGIKDAAEGIQTALDVVSSASVLFVTPFPSILTDKDPYRLQPNDTFTLTMDNISQTLGSPLGVKTINFSATPGSYTGIDNINFSIPSGTKFWMDTYLRRSRLLPAGTIDSTLGLTGGIESPKGVFAGGSDSRLFRIPNAGADFKINTFGKGIETLSGPNSIHDLLGLPLSSADFSIESDRSTFRYHYPAGASFKLSLWSKDTALYNTPNSILPLLSLNGSIYDPSLNEIRGNDARLFTIPSNTGCRISTYTGRRSYPVSSIRNKIGFNSYTTNFSGTLDTGIDARNVYIPGMGGYRSTLSIRSINRVASAPIDLILGLTNITLGHGYLLGEDSFKFTYPAGSFTYNTYVNKGTSITGEVFNLIGWDQFTTVKNSILSGDRRLFNWPLSAGFNITVRNSSGVIFSGQISLIAAGTNRNGITLANQVTFALRQLPGARGIETCTFETNGTFKFYFGNDVTDATFSPHTNPGRDILNSLGITPGIFVPVSFFISSGEPVIYKVAGLGDYSIKLGDNTYTNYIPQGLYTGTNLASLLEAGLQLATGKNEQVAYNPSTGRFSLLMDPSGYISSSGQTITLTASSNQDTVNLQLSLNAAISKKDFTEEFFFQDNILKYTQDGLVSIEFLSGTLLDVFGLPLGSNTASLDVFAGSQVKNLYFQTGDNILQLIVNRSPLVVSLPTDTNMSYSDLQSYVNTNYPTVNLSIEDLSKIKIESVNPLILLNDYLFFYASASTRSLANELIDLKQRFDTALGDSLISFTFNGDKFEINYPDMEEILFNPPGIGNDYINKFGFINASGLTGSYVGAEAAILEIDPSDTFDITLGSSTFNITVPVGEYKNSSLASALENQLSLQTSTYPSISYDASLGIYSFDHENDGYLQINNELLTLSPAVSQTGINIANEIQTSLRSFPTSAGIENCIFIADKFLITIPGLKRIELAQEPGYYSLPLVLGLGFGSYSAESGRVAGLDPAYFFVGPTTDNFDYGLTPFITNVVIPPSTDFESGSNLAQRIKTELNTATGNNEDFVYNAEGGYFSLIPDPDGFQLLANQDIVLPPESGYADPETLLIDLSVQLDAALNNLTATYDNGVFTITYPGLAKMELQPGTTGLKLEEMIGFSLGLKSGLDSEVSSDQPLKYLAFHSDANTLYIRLGGNLLTVSYPVTGTLRDINDFISDVKTGIQALSGRNTDVTYDSISKRFKISIDPDGEKIISDYQPTFAGSSLLTLTDVITELNNISVFSGATGGELFSPSLLGDSILFEDLTGKTLSMETTVGNVFDIRTAFGFSNSLPISGQVELQKIKYYIISVGENDLLNFDLNTDPFNLTITPGIYDSDEITGVLESAFNSTELDSIEYDSGSGVFTITSNPDGKLWTTFNIQLLATSGPLVNVTNALQNAVLFNSSEDDEIFTPDGAKIKEYKPDLRAVEFRADNTSSVPLILKILGFTPDFRYETDTEEITFDEVSPFSVTPTESDFKIKYDNLLDLGAVRLPVVSALSGTEMAAHIQKTLREYLTSFIVKDILYSAVNPLPLVGPPFADVPSYVNSYVSNFLVLDIQKSVVDSLFSSVNSGLYQQLQFSFPTDFSIPYITDAIQQLISIINTSVPSSLLQMSDKFIKDGIRNLIRLTLINLESSVPGKLDPDNFLTSITPLITAALNSAATSLSLPVTNDVKNEVSSIIATKLEGTFSAKYFYDTEVTFDPVLASFTIKSPAKGNQSRVEILPADTLDITNHLGLDIGTETIGTGNVGFIHCVTAEEVANLFNLVDYQAFPFGTTAFRPSRLSFGITLPADYRYPHRYYSPSELPWSSEVYIMARSLNITSTCVLTVNNTVGSPTSAIGIPTGDIGPIVGRSAFTGAFREAGPFNEPRLASKGFVFVTVAALVLPSFDPALQFAGDLKEKYNSIATLIGLPKWP